MGHPLERVLGDNQTCHESHGKEAEIPPTLRTAVAPCRLVQHAPSRDDYKCQEHTRSDERCQKDHHCFPLLSGRASGGLNPTECLI